MNSLEKRAALSLSLVFAFRMLGLFMVLPVMATLGAQLPGATPFLIGCAVGAYGLSQALLQIPFGFLSDRYGRKPIILLGLGIFMLGSLLAAYSESIYAIIIGRFFQGCGAIAGVVMALAADLTRDQHRSKVMASIGASIGAAFILAFSLGPLLAARWQLSGLFLFTAVLAVVAIAIVLLFTPSPQVQSDERQFKFSQLGEVVKEGQLLRLNVAIFLLHFFLTAFFMVIPSALQAQGFSGPDQSIIYIAAMVTGFVLMLPALVVTERKRQHRTTMIGAVCLLAIACFVLAQWSNSMLFLLTAIVIFFTGFNLLEASLPSLVSRIVPAKFKGSALGVYSTAQFLGAFLGGVVGGLVLSVANQEVLFYLCLGLSAIWFGLCLGLDNPPQLLNFTISIHSDNSEQAVHELSALAGVKETIFIKEENTVYLKALDGKFQLEELKRLPFVAKVS